MQKFEVQVQLVCPQCKSGISVAVTVPEPDWSDAENMSDLNSEGATEVQCSNCSTVFPAYVTNNSGSCEVTLDDFPELETACDIASFSPREEGDWGNYDIPDDPYSIFVESYNQVAELLTKLGSDDGVGLINRMIFSQQVTALEAYLGDTLINCVLQEKEAMSRLLGGDKDLVKERFSLAEIVKDPEFVSTKIRQHLRSILYHNLGKVQSLYKCALDIDLLDKTIDSGKLHKAIEYRHDCVHRNGFDKEGKRLDVFTKEYVREIGDLMRSLVERVEKETSDF